MLSIVQNLKLLFFFIFIFFLKLLINMEDT